jgi:hypothetical protein
MVNLYLFYTLLLNPSRFPGFLLLETSVSRSVLHVYVPGVFRYFNESQQKLQKDTKYLYSYFLPNITTQAFHIVTRKNEYLSLTYLFHCQRTILCILKLLFI